MTAEGRSATSIWWLVGVAAPPILLVISVLAAWTQWVGPVPMWLAVPGALAMAALSIWTIARRPQVPQWYPAVAIGTMLVGAFALERTELLSPLTFVAAAGLWWLARQMRSLPGGSQRSWSARPYSEPASVGTEPSNAPLVEMTVPNPAARTVAPATRIPLATRGHVALFAAGGLPTLALGGWALWSALLGRNGLDGTAERLIGGFFGSIFALLGLMFLVGASQLLLGPAVELVVDHEGIRRVGRGTWDVEWTQVRAVGITLDHQLVFSTTPMPASVRRRLKQRVVFAMASGDAPPGQVWPTTDVEAPFTHGDLLPAPVFARHSAIITELDGALRTHVPDLYVGTGRLG